MKAASTRKFGNGVTEEDALVMFTRVPVAGKTKTRLEAVLSPEECARLQMDLVKETLQELAALPCQILMSYSDDYQAQQDSQDALGRFKSELSRAYQEGRIAGARGLRFAEQQGSEFGDRLHRCFELAFEQGARKCVVLGSDVPFVSCEDICRLLEMLDRADAVFGPSPDGGFWAVGLNQPFPELFCGKTFSTEHVLADALDACERHGKRAALGAEKFDIDTPADLKRYLRMARPGGCEAR